MTPPVNHCHSDDLQSWCATIRGCTMFRDYQTTGGVVEECPSLASIIRLENDVAKTELHYGPDRVLLGGVRLYKVGVGAVQYGDHEVLCSTNLETAGLPLIP